MGPVTVGRPRDGIPSIDGTTRQPHLKQEIPVPGAIGPGHCQGPADLAATDRVCPDDSDYSAGRVGREPKCARLSGLSSKNRRPCIDGFPTKKIIGAGPGVDLGLANPAFEFSGTLVGMLLSCCGVIHSATRAGKLFGGPDAVCHAASMRQRRRGSSPPRAGG